MNAPAAAAPAAGGVALASAGATLLTFVLIVALHVLKPELAPSSRFVSEYAIGPYGGIMRVAFVLWALACATLAVGIRGTLGTRRARVGSAVLLVAAVALVVAGVFAQDPVTTKPGEGTLAGTLHAAASLVGIPAIPLAALLLGKPLGASDDRLLRTTTHLAWMSLLAMMAYLGWAVPRAGGFTPEVHAGAMNRLVVAAYLGWQLVAALRLRGR
ncbi:MAG TPA: DUF998 domain-containing protein [Casimicrobiaceae bacterium]|nr:DUF998 domain-containing protein [Casimicrobiaceae bacterium]